jgi:hypothetical protein
MSETQWSEDPTDQPQKKTLPKWVWFCGGGCLLALLATIALVALGVRFAKTVADPAKGWAKLQEIIAVDSPPPPGYEAHYVPNPIMDMVAVKYRGETQLQFQRHEGSDAIKARQQMFESDKPAFPQNIMVMEFKDMTKGTVDVQGRTLPVIRMRIELTGLARKAAGKDAAQMSQYILFTDVTPEGRTDEFVLLQIQRIASVGEIDDDTVREILEPFHIGPNR